MKEYDFVVIGSGIAGLTFAVKAAKHGSVAVVTKRKGADSNTAWAQGGIACVTSDEDSFELHVRDTLEAGAGLCDEEVVRTMVSEGPARIQDLIGRNGIFTSQRQARRHRQRGADCQNRKSMKAGHCPHPHCYACQTGYLAF